MGFIGIRKDGTGEVPNRLSSFYVDPSYQNQGIGRLLYEQVLAKAYQLGCQKLVVSSNPTAKEIYTHFGFITTKETWKKHPNGRRSLEILMEKNLTEL